MQLLNWIYSNVTWIKCIPGVLPRQNLYVFSAVGIWLFYDPCQLAFFVVPPTLLKALFRGCASATFLTTSHFDIEIFGKRCTFHDLYFGSWMNEIIISRLVGSMKFEKVFPILSRQRSYSSWKKIFLNEWPIFLDYNRVVWE